MKTVDFIAIPDKHGNREGEEGWRILVDGEYIISVRNKDMDISANALNELWEKLNITINFDFD